jgi:hypothetical protein
VNDKRALGRQFGDIGQHRRPLGEGKAAARLDRGDIAHRAHRTEIAAVRQRAIGGNGDELGIQPALVQRDPRGERTGEGTEIQLHDGLHT